MSFVVALLLAWLIAGLVLAACWLAARRRYALRRNTDHYPRHRDP